jgi:ABC-type cobalt transport system substrate-binding protein
MTQPKKSISPLTIVLLIIIAGSVGVMFMTCQQTSDSFRRHDEDGKRKVEKLQREYREKQNP